MNHSSWLIKIFSHFFSGLTIIIWGALIRLLFSLLFYLRPLAAERQPAAILVFVLILPMTLYFLQGLFYMPRRASGRPAFIRSLLSAVPLVFLPLPFNSFEAGRRLGCRPAAAARLNLSLAGRLALLLNARSPLDLAFKTLMADGPPPLNRLAALLYLIIGPARLLMRLWGYWALVLWRLSGRNPGQADEAIFKKRAEAFGSARGGGRPGHDRRQEAAPFAGRLKSCRAEDSRVAEEESERPWLKPRYRGLYLDFPVTLWAQAWEDMYDGGPEEPATFFYPPELAEEVIFLGRLKAEKKRLLSSLSGDALLWSGGRLKPSWEVENEIEALDLEIKRQEKRLAAHNRRCRSSSLAAARRRGGEWPGLLLRLGREMFYAERRRPDLKDPALAALLLAEEAVSEEVRRPSRCPAAAGSITADPAAAREPGLGGENIAAWKTLIPEAELNGFFYLDQPLTGSPGLNPKNSEELTVKREKGFQGSKGRRPDFSADSFGVGFGRSGLAAVLLSLLIWQGFSQGTATLSVYNGLACQVEFSLNGAGPLSISPFETVSSIRIKDRRRCRLKVFSRGRLVEDFLAKPLGPHMIYNIAGAAIIVELPAQAGGTSQDQFHVLGRARWLSVKAAFLSADSSKIFQGGGIERSLFAFGQGRPGRMLALLDDENDRVELINAHAHWDEPGSPWFSTWLALVGDSGLRAEILTRRLKADPFFLDKMAGAWPDD